MLHEQVNKLTIKLKEVQKTIKLKVSKITQLRNVLKESVEANTDYIEENGRLKETVATFLVLFEKYNNIKKD